LIKKKYLVSLLIFLTTITFPQVTDSPQNDLKNFFKVGGDLFTAPAHFDSKDWLVFSSTLGLTAASIIFVDEDIKTFALSNRGNFGDALFKIDDLYHIEFMAASMAAFYLYGVAAKNPDVRNLGLRLSEATIYAGSITLLGKFFIGRGRPQNHDNAKVFEPLNTNWEYTSLPSGHSALSFAYSTVMASVYNNFFWKFSWYSLAVLVAAARVYNNAHWFSDVLLGGVIGYFVGDFVNKHHTNQKVESVDAPPNPTPDFSVSFGFAF
jgi:membrane-associated phospholipid phosphatase